MPSLDSLQEILARAWKSPSTSAAPAQVAERTAVRLVIGFDFGTSTSKVIVAGKNPATDEVRRTVLSVAGKNLIPSTVWQIDTRLCFAEAPPGKLSLRSFKSGLNHGMRDNELIKHIRSRTSLSPDVICYGYLSYLVNRTRRHIEIEWPDSQYLITELVWSMGAPISFSGWENHAQNYSRILQAAVDHPANLDSEDAISPKRLKGEFFEACGRPPKAQCAVMPEALVTIGALVLTSKGRIDPGVYCLADIGAGTTDATWFRYSPDRAEKPMLIYSGASMPVAGDRVNTAIRRECPGELHPEWIPIPGLEEPTPLNSLLGEICRVRSDGMIQIGRREPLATFLNEPVSLVLMGGGSNISRITSALARPLMSERAPGTVRARFEIASHLQQTLRSISQATPLHTIALGLSYHPGEHPGFLDRHEISDWEPPKRSGPEFMDHNMVDD